MFCMPGRPNIRGGSLWQEAQRPPLHCIGINVLNRQLPVPREACLVASVICIDGLVTPEIGCFSLGSENISRIADHTCKRRIKNVLLVNFLIAHAILYTGTDCLLQHCYRITGFYTAVHL